MTHHREEFVKRSAHRYALLAEQAEVAHKNAEEGKIPKPKYAEDAIQSQINLANLALEAARKMNVAYHAEGHYDALVAYLASGKGTKRQKQQKAQELRELCQRVGMPEPSEAYEHLKETDLS